MEWEEWAEWEVQPLDSFFTRKEPSRGVPNMVGVGECVLGVVESCVGECLLGRGKRLAEV